MSTSEVKQAAGAASWQEDMFAQEGAAGIWLCCTYNPLQICKVGNDLRVQQQSNPLLLYGSATHWAAQYC